MNTLLTNPEKVYLPLLHIKLGFIKNFLTTMDQNSAGFIYLKNNFQDKWCWNQRRGICWMSNKRVNTGYKIWRPAKWSGKAACKSFKNVTTNFWGNCIAEHCRDMVADLVQSYKAMMCCMSSKVHFLDSHLDFFP